MAALHIDFETRGELDLKEVGLHNYARHPSTDVWCMAWAIDDAEPQVWTPGLGGCPPAVHKYIADGGPVYAHNAPFELEIWNQIMVPRYGWSPLKPERTFCTMAMAYAMGLPGALDDAAMALGVEHRKDVEGRALMLRMARPRRTSPTVWWDEPEKLERLYAYCKQDVRVERELHTRLVPLSAYERKVWLVDYEINQRGIRVDLETANAAIGLVAKVKDRCDAELAEITKGRVTSANALIPFKEWLAENGVPTDTLSKQAIVDLLEDDTLPGHVARALVLRQESAKASTAKMKPMIASAGADGRVRGTLQYHGAATGRWAGRKLQVHNLKRGTMSPAQVDHVFNLIRNG